MAGQARPCPVPIGHAAEIAHLEDFMRTYDLSPLFRSTIGFDRLSRAVETAMQLSDGAQSYPPYNIEKLSEDSYRISMAVAGFSANDLEISTQDGALVIRGKAKGDGESKRYLYRGIAERAFERKFHLADFIRVGGAQLVDGMLHVDLLREVPEALKPRRIDIQTAANVDRPVESKAA